jgi:hydrogenase nickel incorporation protein HypA/HybF
MHEVGIMQSVLDLAEREARTAGSAGISEVRLRIGRLTGVVHESLEFAFSVLKEGTLAEGGQLVVEYVPGAYWCGRCEAAFEAEGFACGCPRCGEFSLDMRRGMEMELVSLEVL